MAVGMVGSSGRKFYPGFGLVVSTNSPQRSVNVRPVVYRLFLIMYYLLSTEQKAQSE